MRARTAPPAGRLRLTDTLRVAAAGLGARRLRAGLSALGIAIGIAALVAVLGISESSRADLIAQLDRLGTNLLRVQPGEGFDGGDSQLPEGAAGAIGRMAGVETVAGVGAVEATVRRTDRIDDAQTGGLSVRAADPGLLRTLGGRVHTGRWLDGATSRFPTVVLGAVAARRLGVTRVGVRVWIGDRWFTVVGLLAPLPLAPDLDRSALVGRPVARHALGWDGAPSTVYVRADPDAVTDVRALLGPTANPEHPEEVQVSRPSDALAARVAASGAFTSLFLGLGAVALLVGGVGIANVMVIAVLERRGEIGLRRALGATRRHVGVQFLGEALLLAGLGGAAGAALGAAATAGYAAVEGTATVVPASALAAAAGASVFVGAVAGLWPALRAARLAPTEALRAV